MGSYLNIYIGPYVECAYRNETHEVDVHGCTNEKCPEFKKRERWASRGVVKFCGSCAGALGPSKKVEPYRPTPYDVMQNRDEIVPLGLEGKEATVRLGSNIKGPRDFHPDRSCTLDLTALDREAEMRWFESRFADDLRLLRAAYDNVTVKWGLHVYYQ
jgi:hypothetical protein